MRVDDSVRKCVGFVVYKSHGLSVTTGTCLFAIQQDNDGFPYAYIITARHVIDEAEEKQDSVWYFVG